MCDAENNPQSGIDYILINEDFCHKFSGLCIRKIPGTHSEGCRCQTLDFLSFRVGYQIIKKAQVTGNVSYLQNHKYVNGIQYIININPDR